MKEYQGEDKPFFLYLSYQAPHDPLQAWPEDIAKYKNKYQVGYGVIADERYLRQKRMGIIDENYPRPESAHREWRDLTPAERNREAKIMAVYAAMIDRMDQNIGRLLQFLKQQGDLDNTLIFFASDNGSSAEVVEIGDGEIGAIDRWVSLGKDWANVSNTPFRYYKNHSYEGGINTPLIVHWPDGGIKANSITSYPGHFIDLMPTVLDIAGAEYPETYNAQKVLPYEGESLLPTLSGGSLPRNKDLYWQWLDDRAVRQGKWKLVASDSPEVNASGQWELYDMETDKTETSNVASDHPEIVQRLSRLYENWLDRVSERPSTMPANPQAPHRDVRSGPRPAT